jgi:hypothetical protein
MKMPSKETKLITNKINTMNKLTLKRATEINNDFFKATFSNVRLIHEEGEKGRLDTFKVILDMHGDININHETYEKGYAHIYLSDEFYNQMNEYFKRVFPGQKLMWNNDRTTAWLAQK